MPTRLVPDRFLVALSLAGEQRELVRPIVAAVEQALGHGTVFFDEWFEHYLAGDDADLTLQDIYGQRCELAVCCVSERYGGKPWTQAEHRAIRARQMQATGDDRKGILPIRVGDGEVPGILFNAIVPDVRNRSAAESAQLIVDRLHLLRPDLRPVDSPGTAKRDWPETPPPLSWPMADHSSAREAFAELLSSRSRWRFLPIRGVSETGKSHISRQMLANALAIPDIACGRFDFKGTTSMDSEVRAFVQDLGVPMPPSDRKLHERLGGVLDELKRLSHPTLLIFDTYEMVGEAQEWVERQLLPCLIRGTWLRVVITGQKVPNSAGSVCAAVARPAVQLVPPQPVDWFDYGKLHRHDLTLAEVETACRLASLKPSLMAQLLGPVA